MENAKQNQQEEQAAFQAILDYVQTTDLDFVQIMRNGRKIMLRRAVQSAPAMDQRKSDVVEAPAAPQVFSVRSPIVGRFFSSMGADRPPLVVEGGHVTAGQKVAIVEAMKIKKEVFSAYTGKVTRIHARDNDPVEYGQELFTIQPDPEQV